MLFIILFILSLDIYEDKFSSYSTDQILAITLLYKFR